jgi:hypothetical protein
VMWYLPPYVESLSCGQDKKIFEMFQKI